MTAASILEYMFITVTCCEEIAKKLYWNTLYNYFHMMCIFWHLCPNHWVSHLHHWLANSRTFQDLALDLQDFPGPNSFSGLSRSWKIYKHNSRTFQEAQEPWTSLTQEDNYQRQVQPTDPSQIFLTLVLSWSPWKKMRNTVLYTSAPCTQ